jgi:hypothetical protein
MSRMFGLVNMVSFIFMSALIFAFITYMHKENDEFEQLRLAYQIDYATDAGTVAMLQTSDLGLDYAKNKYISVNPDLALDTFLTVFCFGYDMIPNTENKNLVKQYIPVAAVATFDGYYIATQRLVKNATPYPEGAVNDGDWDLTFAMKMPYTYINGTSQFALTMGMDYAWQMSGPNLSKFNGIPPGLDKVNAWHIVNKSVSDDMAFTISEFNKANPNWEHQFYIPDRLSAVSGANPIQGPSFLVLVQGLDFTTPRKISGFSISGSRIDNARMVAAYTRNATRYYSYVDKMPGGVMLENLYSTVKEAALAGYYADQVYMQ